MARTGFAFRQECTQHLTGHGHPERPERLEAIASAFEAAGLKPTPILVEPASRQDLLRVHAAEHVDTIERVCATEGIYPDPDIVVSNGSWEAALLASGGAIASCRAVIEKQFDNAFCAMRPPGHHVPWGFVYLTTLRSPRVGCKPKQASKKSPFSIGTFTTGMARKIRSMTMTPSTTRACISIRITPVPDSRTNAARTTRTLTYKCPLGPIPIPGWMQSNESYCRNSNGSIRIGCLFHRDSTRTGSIRWVDNCSSRPTSRK
jgi:hypothetical protein